MSFPLENRNIIMPKIHVNEEWFLIDFQGAMVHRDFV